MNNLKILSALLLIFSFLFISCQDSSITNNKDEQSEIPISKIGYYHNQSLKMIINDEDIHLSDLSYFEAREVIISKLINKYPEKFSKEQFQLKKPIINKGLVESGFLKFQNSINISADLSNTKPVFTGNYKAIINYLQEKNKITKTLSSRLFYLFNNMEEWASQNDIIAYAKKIISKKNVV